MAARTIRPVFEIDISGLIAALPLTQWRSASGGTFCMNEDWPADMPVEPVFEAVAAHYPGRRRGMTCFSKLVPGQYLGQHRDRHDNDCDVRIHVPIISNPSCVFVSDGFAAHMAPGWVWEINPGLMHCTGNGGDTDRVHLFFNMRIQ